MEVPYQGLVQQCSIISLSGLYHTSYLTTPPKRMKKAPCTIISTGGILHLRSEPAPHRTHFHSKRFSIFTFFIKTEKEIET